MKKRRNITKLLIAMLIAILTIGTTSSFAMQDYQGDNALSLTLSYFRYANGEYKDGYALNTTGNESESHHPIYQIMNNTKTNYYCLNATAGESWMSGTIGTSATYNRAYNLNLASDIDSLKNDSSLPDTYKNVANSKYLKQILWILDNIYIPNSNASSEQNKEQKDELLAKAGIVYGDVDDESASGEISKGYRYIAQPNYDYSAKVSTQGKKGYFYYDTQSNYHIVELPDEMVEVATQSALWYFTNYLENNSGKSETYNVKDQWLPLLCSNGTTNTNTNQWKSLESETFNVDTNVNEVKAEVGKWKQEQAAILCQYLIDAANKYAENSDTETTGSPLTISPATAEVQEQKIDTKNYYVVGPIKIDEERTVVYTLSDTITVNGNTETGAYISDNTGKRNSDQTVANYIGKEFYISVPKTAITGNNIKIDFEGTYKANKKTLWISTTKTEQPVVEVDPVTEPINLTVNAGITKEFDLALRKIIASVRKAGTTESALIVNEEGKLATRKITYDASNIERTGTAIYNHRKDPIVVEKGDIVTYEISIYNEGDMGGYASEIVDKLPKGLKLYGETTGTYTFGNVKYSYVYDEESNTITFTNISKNVLAAYEGTEEISSESIKIECEITQEPSTVSNTYLTNIAYISKEYNSETSEEQTTDRDSDTAKIPSVDQNTTGDKYTGYHGGNNQNGDNSKDVYKDGTNNDDYFPGREDDDDFEVVVVKPAAFDLALQKYISSVKSGTNKKAGRQAPIIDTSKLADKTGTTADYRQDKTPVQVKHGDYVTYTFTVYNEGDIDGYVNKITDNIPTGLQFIYPKQPTDGKTLIACDSTGKTEEIEVDESTYNMVSTNNSSWSIDQKDGKILTDTYNDETTTSITCDVKSYLGGTNKLLKAYDSSKDQNNNGDGLDRLSVTVVLRVSAANGAGKTIRNEAAITEAEDKEGNVQDKESLTDRDSQTNQWPGKDGNKNYQDDEDYDNIILGKVDLALTKFITAVSEDINIEDGEYLTQDTTSKNAGNKTNPYTRATKVNTKELRDNAECHDATYIMVKDPLVVPEKSYVLYNIRVYNEGEVDVYAGEVKDYLPNYLDYVDCEFNNNYGWKVSSDGKTVTTKYLAYNENDASKKNLMKAFDKENDDGEGSELDYRDVQILCRVNSRAPDETKLVNSAEITKYQDEDGEDIPEDVDSKPENLENKNKENREEDDDDFEVVEVKKKNVDLALTKFITAISNDSTIENGEYLTADGKIGSKENPYTRATRVETKELRDNAECHDATYIMVKDPLTVPAKSYVLYNIRVYNEGETDVYAGEITDHLPEYLDYVDCDYNTALGWKVGSDGKTIKTSYLGYDKDDQEEKNLLKAFDKKADDGEGSGLDYRDVQVLCRVNDNAPTNTNIINVAEITRYQDPEGEDIPKDIDSTPDNVNEKNEDDDDYEVINIKTFDLSLLKYVTTVYVTEDGETKTTQTGNTGDDNTDIIPKVEINKKKLNSTVVKFGYTIKITNEGDIAGYAKEITDYVPQGLRFDAEDNKGWTDEGNNVISTKLLEDTLLQPGESAEVTVILTWINGSSNLGLKTNTAEISEDYNEWGVPDRDSTPDNQDPGEDDIDDASVLLSITTGIVGHIVTYTIYGAIISLVFFGGIVLIKKYVL